MTINWEIGWEVQVHLPLRRAIGRESESGGGSLGREEVFVGGFCWWRYTWSGFWGGDVVGDTSGMGSKQGRQEGELSLLTEGEK